MAIGGGCDIAMESADVVLVRSSLSDVVSAVKLGRRVVGTVKENLFFAFVYNLIGIPMAAGLFGFSFPPMFGAIAMSLSSLSVVLNSLRIGRFGNKTLQKQGNTSENQAANNIQKEAKGIEKMEIILKVEGMMCPHCEARVREALSAVSGVEQVEVDHKKGEARIKGPAEVKILISTVEAAGYKASV
jgi:Cu2+-exporting ATPase